jgi:prepilin-type N-terminal cleavage/methylation domain-containing protein/prepilin-type processing-associated H-X9-DG protein
MKKSGFTLVELLVVISIIALLLAVLVPSLNQAREQGRKTVCRSNLKGIGTGILIYPNYDPNGTLPPSDYTGKEKETVPKSYDHQPWMAYRAYGVNVKTNEIRGPFNLARLYAKGICPDGKVFYCPGFARVAASVKEHFAYEDYCSAGHPWPWLADYLLGTASSSGGVTVRAGYYYVPQGRTYDTTNWSDSRSRFPIFTRRPEELVSEHIITVDIILRLDAIPHRAGAKKARGLNALFGDGHVNLCTNPAAFDPALWDALDIAHRSLPFRTVLSRLEAK